MTICTGDDVIVGPRLRVATAIANVCVPVLPAGSVTATVTVRDPAWETVGVHSTRPVDGLIVIPAGAMGNEKTTLSPSGSVAVTAYWYATPTVATNGGLDVTTGGRFAAVAETTTL